MTSQSTRRLNWEAKIADLADVMDALQSIAVAATYPGAPGQSVIGTAMVQVGQGWPQANDVDDAMRGNTYPNGRNSPPVKVTPWTLVSIYAVPSTSSDVPQPFNLGAEIIVSPVHGMSVSVAGNTLTLSGQPNIGEYATAIVNGTGYSYAAAAGDTYQSVAAALASQIPGGSASAGTITIAGAYSLSGLIGAPATLGERIHRQRIQFRIVVWSPKPEDRAGVARAIDVALKRNLRITMPDTSAAIVTFQGTNLDDKFENALVYRRDLIFSVMFDTVDEYQGYEITSVPITTTLLPQTAP